VTRLLASVRSVDEALRASESGADFIDLKEPGDGALGGLPLATIGAVVQALRQSGCALPISATIGDLPAAPLAPVLQQVRAVAACGVDYVKVGVLRGPGDLALLQALAGCGAAVVPVFVADHGLDADALRLACGLGFPALMLDTADKAAGSLFDVMADAELRGFVHAVRQAGALAGLAGALRLQHLPQLQALAPDFAGFRSALCAGSRAGTLDPQRLQALARALREPLLMA